MSAIAGFMADKGHMITGSDRAFDSNPRNPLKKTLQSKGITIVPQDGSGLDESFDFAVFSTAVESDRPEFQKAEKLGIPVKKRPDYLAEIAASFRTIAVSGTSGKSTVSGMLAFLMKKLGLDPNLIGGGRVKQFKTSSDTGNSLAGNSDILIIEACESDGTIINYRPEHSIILNLAFDHHTIDKTATMFEILIENTADKVIMNADDENLRWMAGQRLITFSIDNPSQYKAEDIVYKKFSSLFSLGKMRFSLSLPGKYNLYNALSCIALLSEYGISMNAIADALSDFQGIDRRFDIHLNDGTSLVVDDYAHNPHKITHLMESVKHHSGRICYIFQPHGFGPTMLMKKEYIETFLKNLRDTDHLIILPIYYTGGTARREISSSSLADEINEGGKSAEVIYKREDIIKMIYEYRTYIIFGARDESLSELAKQIASSLTAQRH